MPELPEVETVVRGLRQAGIEAARIQDVAVLWPRAIAGMSAQAFAAALRGRAIRRLTRRAKYIVPELDDGRHLLAHLRMTGRFNVTPPGAPPAPHDRVVLHLADGRALRFHDPRKFGRFQLVNSAATALSHLGPEPLDDAFTDAALRARLAQRRRCLKALLLDQSCVAGLGNIYVDEALWLARLHPRRLASSLKRPEIARLRAAIQAVLRQGVAAGGSTLGSGVANFYGVAGQRGRNADQFKVFRRTGQPCPRCGHAIARLIVGQRGTHICPACQRLPASAAATKG
jgi:formamidopyrimidine-DNA glycosylase